MLVHALCFTVLCAYTRPCSQLWGAQGLTLPGGLTACYAASPCGADGDGAAGTNVVSVGGDAAGSPPPAWWSQWPRVAATAASYMAASHATLGPPPPQQLCAAEPYASGPYTQPCSHVAASGRAAGGMWAKAIREESSARGGCEEEEGEGADDVARRGEAVDSHRRRSLHQQQQRGGGLWGWAHRY